MKLTKLQRHTAYILMLHEAETNYYDMCDGWGFCMMVKLLFGEWVYGDDNMRDLLPDLYAKKPKTGGVDWFRCDKVGWVQRKELLRQCIKETV